MKTKFVRLKIYVLGDLLIKKGDNVLYSGRSRALNKRWKLFLLLLFRKDKVTIEELIDKLDLEKNEAPRQSLRSLIYQLRRDIQSEDFTYIANGSGGYHLRAESPYWLDSDHFSDLLMEAGKAERAGEKDRALNLYQEGLNIYRDQFLASQKLEENIFRDLRERYRRIYLEAVVSAGKLFREDERYQKAIEIYRKALNRHPLQTDMHKELIKTYKENNQPGQAIFQAQEMQALSRRGGEISGGEEDDEISELVELDISHSPASFLDDAEYSAENAYECQPGEFSQIYDLERRKAEREEEEIFLVHFRLEGEKPSALNRAEIVLRQVLNRYLRSSDVITKWQQGHYIMLGTDIYPVQIESVGERVKKEFERRLNADSVHLDCQYRSA